MLVDLATAQAHLRVDNDVEDALIELYLGAAEHAAIEYLNVAVYPDAGALASAISAAPVAFAEASTDYTLAVRAVASMASLAERDLALEVAGVAYRAAVGRFRATVNGLVVNDAIRAAILLTLGHLYANREDVVTAVSAVELPRGARSLLMPYRARLGV